MFNNYETDRNVAETGQNRFATHVIWFVFITDCITNTFEAAKQ